jgi:redox-regulated HSP33 family molecular chaperone
MEHNLTKLVQKNVDDVEALPTNQLLEGKTAGDNALLGIEPLGHDSPKTECKCSAKKIFRSLRLLPPEEVDNILRERGQLEALCQICGTVYSMGQEEAGRRFLGANGYPSKYK